MGFERSIDGDILSGESLNGVRGVCVIVALVALGTDVRVPGRIESRTILDGRPADAIAG